MPWHDLDYTRIYGLSGRLVVHRMHTVPQHVFISGVDRKTMNWKERKEKENKDKFRIISVSVGRDSVVGIATRYGLEGPRSKTCWSFPYPFRPALGSI